MASDRQLTLAALISAGRPCNAATAVEAGWPETTAVWLGPNAVEYLAKCGIEVQAGGVVKVATLPTDGLEPPAAEGDQSKSTRRTSRKGVAE